MEMIDKERSEIGAKQNDIDRKLKDFDQRVVSPMFFGPSQPTF